MAHDGDNTSALYARNDQSQASANIISENGGNVKRGKKNVIDTKNHDFAQDGFNYRTAYFRDLDGQYYKLTISVGENSEQKTVYNIGKIERVLFPDINAQRQRSDNAPSAKRNSYKDIISENEPIVNQSIKENATTESKEHFVKTSLCLNSPKRPVSFYTKRLKFPHRLYF